MPDPTSTIIAAIDSRIAELQPELDRLKSARLALTVAPPSAPAAEAPARVAERKQSRKRSPKLTVEAAIDAVRDAIADEPRTVWGIHVALGRSMSSGSKNVIRQALEQLGAVQSRGGAWALPSDAPEAAEAPSAQPSNGHAREAVASEASQEDLEKAYLERAIMRGLGNGPLQPFVLANMIDAPREEVQLACERLCVDGQLEHYSDGRYSA